MCTGPTDTEKLRTIRALYVLAFTAEKSILPMAIELYHLLGDILEGVPAHALDMHSLDRNQLLKAIDELTPQEKGTSDGNHCETQSDSGLSGLEP